MNEKTSIVEAFYNNFLLRDLFAKIVPGSVVLITAVFQNPIGVGVVDIGKEIRWPVILIVAGVAWIVGFAIQQIGEWCHIIRHHPPKDCDDSKDYDNSKKRYEKRVEFKRIAIPSESQQVERYAIIKEATGNGATAIFLALLIFFFRFFPIPFDLVLLRTVLVDQILSRTVLVPGILLLTFACALVCANRSHARKQYEYIESVIEKYGNKQKSQPTEVGNDAKNSAGRNDDQGQKRNK